MAFGTVDTRIGETLVDVDFAVVSFVTGSAHTLVGVHRVNASSTNLARIGCTLVKRHFAVVAGPSGGTLA